MAESLRVVVAYAEPAEQWELPLELPAGATIAAALTVLADRPPFDRLPLDQLAVGIWGQVAARTTVLSPGDRLELYRPLRLDPKEARRLRARSHR